MMVDSLKVVVGSEEWCSFPSLGIPAIKARVDSGAKTSSLHAFNIQSFRRDGELWVSFEVHPIQHNRRVVVCCELPVVDHRSVKSSSGVGEKRYVVRAPMKIGVETWEVELTLANRDSMGYRMLLGREAMSGRVLVDPAASFYMGEFSQDELDEFYGHAERQPTGLKIGVLASDSEHYSNRRLMEAGAERGHEMVFLNINQCYIKLDSENPELHYRGKKVLGDLDAVIPRIKPAVTSYGCALVRHFESLGVHSLNSSLAISRSRDKLFSLHLLLDKGVAVPTTAFASEPLDVDDLIGMVGGAPLVVKPLQGAHEQGVVLAETKSEAEGVINSFKTLHANLLVQQFVAEAEGRDLRCFVINGKVVASIQRQALSKEAHGAIKRGGPVSVVKLSAEEKKLAVNAAKVMNLKVAGVDIIRSSRGPLLLGISSMPGLETVESVSGKNIAANMIAAIEKRLGWKRG